MSTEKLIVGLTGMPGAGKSVVVEVAKEKGFDIVVMGDIVREEAVKRHLEPSPENLGRIMLDLREKEGNSVIARRCVSKIEKARERKVIVDGIRSLSEVEEFKKHFPNFTLIAVHASPETRFKRLFLRQRSDIMIFPKFILTHPSTIIHYSICRRVHINFNMPCTGIQRICECFNYKCFQNVMWIRIS